MHTAPHWFMNNDNVVRDSVTDCHTIGDDIVTVIHKPMWRSVHIEWTSTVVIQEYTARERRDNNCNHLMMRRCTEFTALSFIYPCQRTHLVEASDLRETGQRFSNSHKVSVSIYNDPIALAIASYSSLAKWRLANSYCDSCPTGTLKAPVLVRSQKLNNVGPG